MSVSVETPRDFWLAVGRWLEWLESMVAFRSKRCVVSSREYGKLILGKIASWFKNLRMKPPFKVNKRRGKQHLPHIYETPWRR
jgi:hypothetical protein